mgnify:CR=1 FL=1
MPGDIAEAQASIIERKRNIDVYRKGKRGRERECESMCM